jgi:hypothetical protein
MGVAFPMASGGGGAAAFSPSNIAGLQLHRTPADIESFADAASIDTFTATVGGTVSQGSAGARPTAQTNELNGYAVIRYDGGDSLSTSVTADNNPVTRIAVVKATNFTDDRTIFGCSGNNAIQLRLDITTGNPHWVDQGTADIGVASSAVAAATWTIVAATLSGAGEFAFYIAGVAAGTGTQNENPFTSRTLVLGADSGAAEVYLGDMAEELQYDSVLSTANLNLVGGYLATKYGLTWTGL